MKNLSRFYNKENKMIDKNGEKVTNALFYIIQFTNNTRFKIRFIN